MQRWQKSFMRNKAKTYTVYVHENSTNGKVYIGITSQKPENRWRNGKGYLTGYAKKTPFANAIMKYGWENFSHHIVLSDISQERANQIEQNLIRVFNSTDRSKGYWKSNYAITRKSASRPCRTRVQLCARWLRVWVRRLRFPKSRAVGAYCSCHTAKNS